MVVDIAARHALTTQEVLWEEGDVRADEEQPEVQLARPFRVLTARHFADPVIDACEDTEDGTQAHHIVEMRNNIVGVMIGTVDARLAQDNARHTTKCEEEDETNRKQHRCFEGHRTLPHGCDPREDLDACRYRDHHGCDHEIGLLVQRHADCVHVVRPDNEAQAANGDQGPNHWQVAKDRLAREGCNHMADDAEGRQNHDVNLGVTEEPEDVLEQDRVTAACNIKEAGAEVTVGQQHGDGTCQNGQGQKQQPSRHEDRPRKKRHFEHCHAWGTHVQECRDDVDRTKDRGRA